MKFIFEGMLDKQLFLNTVMIIEQVPLMFVKA